MREDVYYEKRKSPMKVQRFAGVENIVNSPRIEQRGNFVSVPARQIA